MERLQDAIRRARAQRHGSESPAPMDAPAPSHPARAPQPDREAALAAAWAALKPATHDRAALRKHRVVADVSGPEAAPYDMLRTKVLQQASAKGWKRIAITSADVGSGKSTSMANLAFSFSRQSDRSIVVLDFDLRRSGLSRILAQDITGTMGDVLRGEVDFADQAVRIGDNVALGLSHGPVHHPSELLQSKRTAEFLDWIDATYAPGLILFDMPPVMAADDSVGFFKNIDAAMLVAAADQTSMDRIDVAERQVAELTNVMGIVLNKCRFAGGAYGYDYGYY